MDGSLSVHFSGDIATSLVPSYSMTKAEADAALAVMEEAADEAIELVTADMTDYEKALIVHDWLVVYCEYDKENLDNKSVPAVSHSAYGALGNKIAVCDGYSKAYQYIMESKLSIPAYIVSSDPMNHAWNMIQIGGKYYHVDATWDDPTWDSIGRVMHNNFLLSDTGITSSGHYDWVTDLTASDTTYENALWNASSGKLVPYGNNWYYADDDTRKIVKTSDLSGSQTTEIYDLGMWKSSANGYWSGTYSYPQVYKGKYLIFNDAKTVYKMDMRTESVTTLYAPSDEELSDVATNIYGLKLDGETLYYAVQSSPNLTEHQRVYIKSANVEIEPRLTGSVSIDGEVTCDSTLTANVTLGSGIVTTLSYTWYRDGVKIESAAAQTYKVTTEDIGKVLSVKVEGEDYTGTLTAQTVKVPKIVPETPAIDFTLTGSRGKQLSTLTLPSGYAWVNPAAIMSTIGTHTYEVTYCPDEAIYEKVTGLSVSVSVECVEHEYNEGVVTKEPAAGVTGIRTYTCIHCQFTREESIPALTEPGDGDGEGNENGTGSGNSGETGSGTGSEIGGENESETGSETGGEIGSGTGSETGGENESETGTGSGSETGGEAGSESGGETGTGTETGGETGTGTNPGGGTDPGTNPDKGTGTNPDNGTGKEPESNPDTDVIKKGETFTDSKSKNKYKITKVTGKAIEASFVGTASKTKKTISIPATVKYKGKTVKVTKVAKNALKNNKKVKSVTIGKNITTIEANAFYGCKNLKTITINSKNIKSFGKNCIKNIHKKATIKCPKGKKSAYKKKLTKKTGYISSMKVK